MKWFTKALCRDRRACFDCRMRTAFRESLHAKGWVDEANFACPHGIGPDNLPLPAARVIVRRKGCGTCRPVVVG